MRCQVQMPYGTPSNVPPSAAHQYYGNYNYPPYMNLAQGHMAPYGAYMAPTGYGGYGPQHGASGYGAPSHQGASYQQHGSGYGSQPGSQGPSTASSGAFKGAAGAYPPQYNQGESTSMLTKISSLLLVLDLLRATKSNPLTCTKFFYSSGSAWPRHSHCRQNGLVMDPSSH